MASISYIVPCYNASNTIERCLDSIRIGGGDDFEIVIVDDCSKDNSVDILRRYRDNVDSRLVIAENPTNCGAGETRNAGVSLATKEYITFVDSDDTIESCFYAKLSSLLDTHYDAIIFNANSVIGDRISKYKSLFCRNIKEGKIQAKEALVYAKGGVLGKIYRREVIVANRVRFAAIPRNEDLVFTKTALSYCSKVYYLNAPLYNYIDNINSLMHDNSLLTTNNAFKAFAMIKNNLADRGFDDEINSIYLIEIIYASTLTTMRLGKNNNEIRKHYKSIADSYRRSDKYFWNYSWKYIIVFYMMRLGLFGQIKKLV